MRACRKERVAAFIPSSPEAFSAARISCSRAARAPGPLAHDAHDVVAVGVGREGLGDARIAPSLASGEREGSHRAPRRGRHPCRRLCGFRAVHRPSFSRRQERTLFPRGILNGIAPDWIGALPFGPITMESGRNESPGRVGCALQRVSWACLHARWVRFAS